MGDDDDDDVDDVDDVCRIPSVAWPQLSPNLIQDATARDTPVWKATRHHHVDNVG